MTEFQFRDGAFRFFTAVSDWSGPGWWIRDKDTSMTVRTRTTFRVRGDNTPEGRAQAKGIRWNTELRLATEAEIQNWMRSHPDYPVQACWTEE